MANRVNDKNNWVRRFEVTQPVRHQKGFTVYKVISTVFPAAFPDGVTKITVWKRYNDFKKLYKELQNIHRQLYLSGEFPKFPKARVFGRFDYEVVEERKQLALTLLNFAASHSQLFTSKIFVKFFETGYNIDDLADESNSSTEDTKEKLDPCLVPEKLWNQSSKEKEQEDDHISVSSITSSSPETTAFTADSDSLLSASVLSIVSDNFLTPAASESLTVHSSSDFASVDVSATTTVPTSKPNTTERKRSKGIIPSTSVTGGFSSVLHEETNESISNSPLVSNSVSCCSLDALPVNKTKTANSNFSSTNNVAKKKNNIGFGFFDFLPIFPKKIQDKKVSDEKLLADSLTASYICEAAGHFAVAQHHESNSDFFGAFTSYKEGIRILLVGAQNDKDQKRRILVRNKLEKYLQRAESLHADHLWRGVESGDASNSKIPLVLSSPTKKWENLLMSESSKKSSLTVSSMAPSDIEELKNYKVVGLTKNNIIVVVNMMETNKPKCFAIKVLTKSSCPVEPEKPAVTPVAVPFMVKLWKWFNTENSVVLLMQYAGGGRLIDFVTHYQTKQIAIVSHDYTPNPNDNDSSAPTESNFSETSPEEENSYTVLGGISELEDRSNILKPSAKRDQENCGSCTRLFPQHSESSEAERVKLATKAVVAAGEDDKKVICTKCFNGVEKKKQEEQPGAKARRGNLESESKSRSESETKDSAVAASFASVFVSRDDALGAIHQEAQNVPVDVKKSSPKVQKLLASLGASDCVDEPHNIHHRSDLTSEFPLCPQTAVEDTITKTNENGSVLWKNPDPFDTHELIESSKVLIQTVSHTLARERGQTTEIKDTRTVAASTVTATPSFTSCEETDKGDGLQDEQKNIYCLETNTKANNTRQRNFNIGYNGDNDTISITECSDGDKYRGLTKANRVVKTQNESESTENNVNEHLSFGFTTESNCPKNVDLRLNQQNYKLEICEKDTENDGNTSLVLKRMVPECSIKVWAAEMVLALEKLHSIGLTYGDLDMRNVLLGENGHILISFTSEWPEVDQVPISTAYSAPEVRTYLGKSRWKLHPSADWWSLGAILFHLLTGQTVESVHLEGFHTHTVLKIPERNICGELISASARTLLTELLQYSPNIRLGYFGAAEIKSHPLFEGFDWEGAVESLSNESEQS